MVNAWPSFARLDKFPTVRNEHTDEVDRLGSESMNNQIKRRIVLVTGCSGCNFVDLADEHYPACGAPGTGEGILFERHDDDLFDDLHAPDPPDVAPVWCTLRKQSVLMVLDDGQ